MDKTREGQDHGWGVGMAGVRGELDRKGRQLYLNNKKMKKWGKINTKDYKKIL